MKKIIFFVAAMACTQFLDAQSRPIDEGHHQYPPTSIVNGEMFWCGAPITKMTERAEIIFEGRILSDSIYKNQSDDDIVTIDYRVLVLKQFKGNFTSDTIIVQNDMFGWKNGDEALFCLFSYGNTYHALYGSGCGFVGICNRKDVKEKIYDPLQAALGRPYVEVHPNNCKVQNSSSNLK